MSSFKIVVPPPSLQKYVKYFWTGEVYFNVDQPNFHLETANSKPQLLFRYCGDYISVDSFGKEVKTVKAGLFGQSDKHIKYELVSPKAGFFGVRFYPYALQKLFNIPSNEIVNGNIDVQTLLGANGSILLEKMVSATGTSQRVNIITAFLESQLQNCNETNDRIENAIKLVHLTKGRVLLPDLISCSYLSPRQFERRFKELSGFSAKTYLKIVRFESVVQAFQLSKLNFHKNLKRIAIDYGYYDQPHFNHEFKIFTGMSPSAYFKLSMENNITTQ